jgi:hypothetical protein
MTVVTQANVLTASQGNLWTLIKTDATVLSYTKNILDGVPVGLTKGTGFPYVIVPTPTGETGGWKTLSKRNEWLTFTIEVYDRKESVLRGLCDAIRNVCENNRVLFARDNGMYQYENSSTALGYLTDEDGSIVYNYTITLKYLWWDC